MAESYPNFILTLYYKMFPKASFSWVVKVMTVWKRVKEDLPRNIPAKFGRNWPGGLLGELLTTED